ncbi:MAG: hypothetical protein IJ328_02670 [Muribaculaceae bacterium]|nr:hypothetical protein [Muribaculaceae bacterium]
MSNTRATYGCGNIAFQANGSKIGRYLSSDSLANACNRLLNISPQGLISLDY